MAAYEDALRLHVLPAVTGTKQGLVLQARPKTRAGWRRVHLPTSLIDSLQRRGRVESEWYVVFPSQQGKLRDRSNTSADLRQALDPLGFGWVTSHTFRKTAATLLDASGLSVREIADQLGHRRVSMTQDTYFGRRDASPDAARALDVIGSPVQPAAEFPAGKVRLRPPSRPGGQPQTTEAVTRISAGHGPNGRCLNERARRDSNP